MAVTFHIEHFEGPLDLLLQLVEQEKLDISTLSLATVAEQFVEHVHENPKIAPEELADFLVVAARLMYMKSKLLIPDFHDAELEEGPDLETQLREYQRFVAASREIDRMWKSGQRSFTRPEVSMRPTSGEFVFPVGVTSDLLMHVMKRVISRLEPILRLPETSVARVVSIQDKIRDLFRRVRLHAGTTFQHFLKGAKDKTEAIVSFLALLELVKQKFVQADQVGLFDDIAIETHPEAPEQDPVMNDEALMTNV